MSEKKYRYRICIEDTRTRDIVKLQNWKKNYVGYNKELVEEAAAKLRAYMIKNFGGYKVVFVQTETVEKKETKQGVLFE